MKEERPWGWYETIESGEGYKVKRIHVHSGQRFSLQFHRKREEHWVIIDGTGVVTLGEHDYQANPGSFFTVSIEQRHRVAAGKDGLTFIEVQRGQCSERDIVRLEDDYGRHVPSFLEMLT